jgi:hypothetical protein
MRKISILIFVVIGLFVIYVASTVINIVTGLIGAVAKFISPVTGAIEKFFGFFGIDVHGYGWLILLALIFFFGVSSRKQSRA